MKGSEFLLGIIKSCSDALAYVNKRVEDVYKLYATLQNNYDQNVVIRNPQNGISTQNVTMGLTFGLSDSTFANIPTYTFTVGSKLRYARILPFNQADGLEVVNFQTLQNYMNEMIGLTTSEALPSYAGLPEGYFLDLQGSPATPTWIPFPNIIPSYDTVADLGKRLTIVPSGIDWMPDGYLGGSSGTDSLTIGVIFGYTATSSSYGEVFYITNFAWTNTISGTIAESYTGSGNTIILPNLSTCYKNYLNFTVSEDGIYNFAMGSNIKLYDGVPSTSNEIILSVGRATLATGHSYYLGGTPELFTYGSYTTSGDHPVTIPVTTGVQASTYTLNTLTITKV